MHGVHEAYTQAGSGGSLLTSGAVPIDDAIVAISETKFTGNDRAHEQVLRQVGRAELLAAMFKASPDPVCSAELPSGPRFGTTTSSVRL